MYFCDAAGQGTILIFEHETDAGPDTLVDYSSL